MSLEMWSNIIELGQYLAAGAILYLCTLHAGDMIKKSDFSFGRNTKTSVYYWFLFTVALSVVLTFIGKRIDNSITEGKLTKQRDENRNYQDQNTKRLMEEMAKYGLNIKATNDSNPNIQIYQIEEAPNLTTVLPNNSDNPILVKYHDTSYVKIIVGVEENLTAKLTTSVSAFLYKSGKDIHLLGSRWVYKFPDPVVSQRTFMPEISTGFLKSIDKFPLDTIYFFHQINYTNNAGKPQSPYRRIYIIKTKQLKGELDILNDEYTKSEINKNLKIW